MNALSFSLLMTGVMLNAGAQLLLKGSNTLVTDGSRLYTNRTGNPGMGTGGSGDVLAGFIAGLLEFIPTVGPILSAIPGVLMGFVDSPEKALAVGVAYWGIQFLENNLLIPFLMRGEMDLPPAIMWNENGARRPSMLFSSQRETRSSWITRRD